MYEQLGVLGDGEPDFEIGVVDEPPDGHPLIRGGEASECVDASSSQLRALGLKLIR